MTGAFVIALLALVISTASLTWQIVQFLLGASRPRVELRIGAMSESGALTGPNVPDRLDQHAVAAVGAGDSDVERQPAGVNEQVVLAAALGPVSRVRAGQLTPL